MDWAARVVINNIRQCVEYVRVTRAATFCDYNTCHARINYRLKYDVALIDC